MVSLMYIRLKILLDPVGAVLLTLLLGPVFLMVGLAIRVADGAPVLFKQQRIGQFGREFCIYKFRTMTSVDGGLLASPDSKRTTRLGKVLRRYSIDELPQLWNIAKGKMAFVGPRPLLVEYRGRFSSVVNARHDVKPGLTGLAQISGRNNLTWDQKFEADVKYVRAQSFALDLWIIAKTLPHVFQGVGVSPFWSEDVERYHN